MAIANIQHPQPKALPTNKGVSGLPPITPNSEGGATASVARQRWGNARVTDRNRLYLGTQIGVLAELGKKVTKFGGDARFLSIDGEFYTPYPQDIIDATGSGLKITRMPAYPLNQIHDGCRVFLSAKIAGNNAIDKFKDLKVGGDLTIGASQSETYEGFLQKNQVEAYVKSMVSPEALRNVIFTPISCGNMLKLTDNHGSKVLVVGEYSIENEFVIQTLRLDRELMIKTLIDQQAYSKFKEDTINFLKGAYNLKGDDKMVVLLQNSYHLDLDICSPRPGYVIVGSYHRVLDAELTELERYQNLAAQKTEFIKKTVREPADPLNLADTKKILLIKQEILNQMAFELEQIGMKVIRAFGSFPLAGIINYLSSGVKKNYCKSDYYETFNFLNGVSMKAPDESYHYFCFGTYDELKSEQILFKATLKKIGVKCHFIGKHHPAQNHVYLQVDGAGPHCMTTVVCEEESS